MPGEACGLRARGLKVRDKGGTISRAFSPPHSLDTLPRATLSSAQRASLVASSRLALGWYISGPWPERPGSYLLVWHRWPKGTALGI